MNPDKVEIIKNDVIKEYESARKSGDNKTMQVLENLFGKQFFNIKTRIKTFNDACKELGDRHPLVLQFLRLYDSGSGDDFSDVDAYLKLRIICAALNEGWEPKFTTNEWRYYPWFYLYTKEELNKMSREKKENPELIDITDTTGYKTDYAGFAFAYSYTVLSEAGANFGSRLCLKTGELAEYCAIQFTSLWLDLYLTRKKIKSKN